MSSSVATSQANVYRANCQCELNFLVKQRSGQRRPLASLPIAHFHPAGASATCAHILYSRRTHGVLALLVRTSLQRRRRRGVRPAATYWKTPHAGGETVAARLWLLTPYKTLLCTALCNVVLSPRLAAPALLCAISYSRVQVSFIRSNRLRFPKIVRFAATLLQLRVPQKSQLFTLVKPLN